MRALVLSVSAILIWLLSFSLARSVVWWLKPFVAVKLASVATLFLVIGTAFLVALFFGAFRASLGYLAVLWLWFLSAVVSAALIALAKKFGFESPLGFRVFALASFVGLVSLAVYNAYTPVVRHLTVQVDKPLAEPVRLALASDTHLGAMVGNRELANLAEILRRENVDVLLLPGDIMDDDTEHFDGKQMAQNFADVIAAPHVASIASLGNHDLYQTHAYRAITSAITDSRAILLNDEAVQLSFTKNGAPITLNIIGRFDDHHAGRAPTSALMAHVDSTYPTILLDHRPSEIMQNVALPIDLQVSGHTHNGQVFPANFIVKMLNRVGYGHEKIDGTHVVVSSGYGFWGIPFRLGSQSEVWVIEMVGKAE
ncbi:hypothetical protein B0181_04695 [Moraxella caviae]|uniref:Calcineurin-like phosphoesterase domain-containing protein n=1 Tax=Moraxella caviae TaxID=34060 RepID=A0A1T0A446_9GAMM|nr:hypothetical protein B0181_04695 [Moraxella caviae]